MNIYRTIVVSHITKKKYEIYRGNLRGEKGIFHPVFISIGLICFALRSLACCLFQLHTYPSPHLPRTKAAPSSLHACISLASSSRKFRSGYASVSRTTCGKDAGLLYDGFTESDVVVPALKRRKSEGGAKNKR